MADDSHSPAASASPSGASKHASVPKDRPCPFCHQPFTSSSLGRHLDLYIKEKNPKPPDGVHDVDEIRRMRSAITRRQPRNAAPRKAEKRTWAAAHGSPESDSQRPSSQGRDGQTRSFAPAAERAESSERMVVNLNTVNWEATGVINNLPSATESQTARSDDDTTQSGSGSRAANGRYQPHGSVGVAAGPRPSSRQNSGRVPLDQRQKLADAQDTARAAELALREVYLTLRSAGDRGRPPMSPFTDFDPFTLDFPTLTLQCLECPPTLMTSHSPIPSPKSWSVSPPGQQQCEALAIYFQEAFRKWRTILMIRPEEDVTEDFTISFNLAEQRDFDRYSTEEVIEKTHETEERLRQHLQSSFDHWMALGAAAQSQIWVLCLARAINARSERLTSLEHKVAFAEQRNNNLKLQMDQLSRYQHPREFTLRTPDHSYVSNDFRLSLVDYVLDAEKGRGKHLVGFELADKNDDVGTLVNKCIQRWKAVVKDSKERGSGFLGQPTVNSPADHDTPRTGGGPHATREMELDTHVASTEGNKGSPALGHESFGPHNAGVRLHGRNGGVLGASSHAAGQAGGITDSFPRPSIPATNGRP